MIEKIFNQKKLYALIVRRDYQTKIGANFFTDTKSSQQVGYINYKKGHIILPIGIIKYKNFIYYRSNYIIKRYT